MPIEYEATPSSVVARYANGVQLVCDFLPTAFGDRDPQYHTSTGTCPIRYEGDEGWVETGDNSEIVLSENLARTQKRAFVGTGLSSAGSTSGCSCDVAGGGNAVGTAEMAVVGVGVFSS